MVGMHFNYVLKVLCMADRRLPRILLYKMVGGEVGWYNEWMKMSELYDCELGKGREGTNEWSRWTECL